MKRAEKFLPEPLTPREVKEQRLTPREIIERWSYRATRPEEMPEQMRQEYLAARQYVYESIKRGTTREDYPQLYRVPGPFADLICFDGLIIHNWQL